MLREEKVSGRVSKKHQSPCHFLRSNTNEALCVGTIVSFDVNLVLPYLDTLIPWQFVRDLFGGEIEIFFGGIFVFGY